MTNSLTLKPTCNNFSCCYGVNFVATQKLEQKFMASFNKMENLTPKLEADAINIHNPIIRI